MIKEILNDASNTNDLQTLINLWNEIANNKYEYSLVEIKSANEIIRGMSLKSNGSDLAKGMFYMNLSNQIKTN